MNSQGFIIRISVRYDTANINPVIKDWGYSNDIVVADKWEHAETAGLKPQGVFSAYARLNKFRDS